MNFTVAADFYSAGFNVDTLPTSGGATSVVYSSPVVSNITTFAEAKEHSYFANHKIWNDGNHGSASGLDADLLDGQHGSYYAAASSLGNSANWNTAYGWGNHASAGYLTSYTDTNTTYSAGTGVTLTGTTFSLTDTNAKLNLSGGTLTGALTIDSGANLNLSTSGTDVGDIVWNDSTGEKHRIWDGGTALLHRYRGGTAYSILTKADITDTEQSNWNTAYGWGNHASAGYAAASSLSSYLPLTGGTLTGAVAMNDTLSFNTSYNEWMFQRGNMKLRSDGNYAYFQGVNGFYMAGFSNLYASNLTADFGAVQINGTTVIDASRAMSPTTVNISTSSATTKSLTVLSSHTTNAATIVVGNTVVDQTLVDSNTRPMVVIDGKYPVLNINHTVTSNANHGPTIQFTHEGYNSNRQVVIGTDGQGQRLDFGFSGGTAGSNTDKNPHNGIAGYTGLTPMRLFQNGLLLGSTGVYPNHITSVSHALDVHGTVAIGGTTVIDSSRNITATRFRSANGTIAPLSSSFTFSNVFTSEDSSTRVAYFDGNGGNASVWWGNGANAHAALDSGDGVLDVWVNPSNGSWYNIADFSTSGLAITTGGLSVGGNTVWHAGNGGSGSGLDADLLDGYNSAENGGSTIHRLASNGYSQLQNWTNVAGAGIYSTTTNGAHFSPNGTGSYGTWKIDGSRNGYTGIYLANGGGVVKGMYDAGGNGGDWAAGATSGWHYYYHRGNRCLGVSGSATSSSYGLYEQGGGIYSTGNITAYSDRRVKENIRTIDNALETVEQMRGVYYNRIDDEEKKTVIGFIAQEVDEIEGAKPLVTYAEDVDQYGVSYGNTAALLVEAIKDLSQQVKDLQSEIKEMKNA